MSAAIQMTDGLHVGGLTLAGIVMDGHLAARDRAAAQAADVADVVAVRRLGAALRTERAETARLRAELAAMRTRALKAEAALGRLGRA